MTAQVLPKETADAFVQQYYLILNRSPENVHKFYQDSSFISWPEPDGGDMTPVTTINRIKDKVMSSDYKYCSTDISTVDAQESSGGGVLVYVTGSLTTQEGVKKNFNQIFFLAEQHNGYFVLNDILRFVDSVVPTSVIVANDGNKNDETAASLESLEKTVERELSAASEAPESPGSSFPPIKGAVANNDSSVSQEAMKPASVAKVEAPKISYASVVAKVAPVTSPKASLATSDARKQPKPTKVSSLFIDGALKSSAKEDTASQMSKNASSANPSPNAEVKGLIYVGGLPYDITKQGIADVIKKFGPIKKSDNAIHIKRHEDGFCCGFVEFESADAAQRAADARHVMFGDKEAYITLKKSPNNRSNSDSRAKPSPKGAPGNVNIRT